MRCYLIAVIVSAAGFATALAQAPATVLDGVYTTEQAERGHAAYERYCVQCHEGLEDDGPDLTNKAFLDRWREDKLEPLFTFIKTTMPGNTPGSLDERVYADIIAFMLEAQSLPAGTRELTPEMVGSIQLVGPDGPQPLANLTIVRAVGCLSAAANDDVGAGPCRQPAPGSNADRRWHHAGRAEGVGGAGAGHAGVSPDERQAAERVAGGPQGAGEGCADEAEDGRADQRHVARLRGPDVWRVT